MGPVSIYEEGDRLVVCDGQQRTTTLSLLIASIRIAALRGKNQKLADKLFKFLIHDVDAYKTWAKDNQLKDIKDGEYLEFFRVVPTFSDRRAFYLAVLDDEGKFDKTTQSLIMKCKRFFLSVME